MTIADRAGREVVEFHAFLEDWLAGRVPNGDATYARAERALAEEFEITSPSGETRDRETILADLRDAHGSAPDGFAIRVEDVRTRFAFEGDGACLVTDEEHQRSPPDEEGTRRYSTAVFGDAPGTANGVEWRHLHGTWRPGGAPGAD